MSDFDLLDPTSWLANDEMLWMHMEWYMKIQIGKKLKNIPGAPSGGTKHSTRIAEVKSEPSECSEALVYRIEGVDVTKKELLKNLKDTEKSVSQEYSMRRNGDPLGDLEADWYEELKEFLTPEDKLIDEDDPFTLWTAKQHFKLDKRAEKKMHGESHMENGSSSATGSSTGSRRPKTETKTVLPSQIGTAPCGMKKNKSEDVINEQLKEFRKEVGQMKEILPKLKQHCLKMNKASRVINSYKLSDDGIKKDIEKIIKDIKMLNTIAQRNHM
uniref:3-phosphoshikimate 1-carboxyvinyltransferase n=1 Tax=Lygus hesperus TaxID=30085 RepID=A0A0A9X8E0_LYGHE